MRSTWAVHFSIDEWMGRRSRASLLKSVRTFGAAAAQSCFCFGILALACGFLWEYVTVERNYGGNWTALFCIADGARLPPELDSAYRFRGSTGFDGQYYYVMALDPAFRQGTVSYIDYPGLRYHRILLPALAHLLALGRPGRLPFTYLFANLGFLFLGAWWMSKHAVLSSRHPAWGLLFLLIPAVPISLDRQTVDLAFTALALGSGYAWRTERWHLLAVLIGLSCLVRETGLVLLVGFLIGFLRRRDWRGSALLLASTLPFWAWTWYVNSSFPLLVAQNWIPSPHPYVKTIQALLHAPAIPYPPAIRMLVWSFDLLAIFGFLLGCFLSVRVWRREPCSSSPLLSGLLFAGLSIYLFSLDDDWTHVYDYGRIASPTAAFLLTERFLKGSAVALLPAAFMTARVAVQLSPQLLHTIAGS
jgi:hypothetical protein